MYDFQKRSSLIQVSRDGAQTLGRIAAELALGEACRRTPPAPSTGWTSHERPGHRRRQGHPDAPSGARIAATVRADVRALAAYPVAEATGCIKLDAMECPYELPEAVREDIARAVRDTPLNRYPSADLSALQQAVRAAFGVPDAAGLLSATARTS